MNTTQLNTELVTFDELSVTSQLICISISLPRKLFLKSLKLNMMEFYKIRDLIKFFKKYVVNFGTLGD